MSSSSTFCCSCCPTSNSAVVLFLFRGDLKLCSCAVPVQRRPQTLQFCCSCSEETMTGRMLVVLTALLTAGTRAEQLSSSAPELHSEVDKAQLLVLEDTEDVMATGDLNPNYYPAQRAAKVVQHYLMTRYGTPHRVILLDQVQKASVEEVAGLGRKYHLELSVHETNTNRTESVSAEVVFLGGEHKPPPQVQATCDRLLQINTQALDEAFYQKHRDMLVSAQNIPDSYGYVDPNMEALWNLGKMVSSEVMLRESSENTLYNLAQVASVTQLETENAQLRFQYRVLLHEMVSQEIITWKLLVSWSPAEGIRVLETEWIPKCDHCVPPNH